MKHLGDITKIDGAKIPKVDVITGGSPCQDLSVAGKRAGLDGERSGLFMEQIRVIKEMRTDDKRNGRTGRDVRPRYMVWENVTGAFSSNGGKDFQAVLTEIVRIVSPECPDVPMPGKGGGGASADRSAAWERTSNPFPWLGEYTMHSTTVYRNGEKDYAFWLTSTDTPRPQFCLTLNLSERPRTDNLTRLSDVLESNPDPKYALSAVACAGILRRAKNRGKELPEQLETALKAQQERERERERTLNSSGNGVAGTLDAHYCLGCGARGGKEREFVAQPQSATLRKTAHPMNAEQGQGYEHTDVSDTPNAFDNSEARTPTLVVQAVDVYNQTENGDIAPTVTAAVGGG